MKIKIKKFTLKDISKKYINWLRDKELTKYTEIKNPKITEIYNYVKLNIKDQTVDFWKIIINEKIHIGNIRIKYLSKKSATIGIIIGDKRYKNKGMGKLSLFKTIKILKRKKIKIIHAFINKENKPSIKIFKDNGFNQISANKEKYTLKI